MSTADAAVRTAPAEQGSAALVAGRAPVAAPAAAPVAVLLAVLVMALGVVGVRDALVAAGALGGSLLTARTADAIDGLGPEGWMLPVGVVLALVGMWWVLAALRPRRRTELPLSSHVSVWTRPADVARLATATTDDIPGVTKAGTTATRRRVTVRVQTSLTDTTEVHEQISEAVTARLSALSTSPRVVVRARSSGGSR